MEYIKKSRADGDKILTLIISVQDKHKTMNLEKVNALVSSQAESFSSSDNISFDSYLVFIIAV